MITYQADDVRDGVQSIATLRASHARIVLVNGNLDIECADPAALRLLADIGPALPDRLPNRVKSELERWMNAPHASNELTITPAAAVIVRAVRLEGMACYLGLLVERFVRREELQSASMRYRLSRREVDVLRLLLEGDSASEIARRLDIGECTVGDYVKRLFAKTNVRNRSEMIAKVLGWRTEPHVPSPVLR